MQFLVAILSLPFYIGLWSFLNFYIKYIGAFVYLSFEISFILTTLSDPGVVTKKYFLENYNADKTVIKNFRICRKCNVVMDLDKGTSHCVECGICVMNNDHHCPWTSKCIGKKNIWISNCFLVSLFSHIVYLVFALVSLAVYSASVNQNNKIKNKF